MSKSKDLETKGPIIYVTPVPTKDGSFMCTIKKNKNPSDNEKTCEIMAMGMMKMALTDPAYVYDLGLEAIEENTTDFEFTYGQFALWILILFVLFGSVLYYVFSL